MTYSSSQPENPYAGQYSGSPITFSRRASVAPSTPTQRPVSRNRDGQVSEGDDSDSWEVEGADYPGEPPRRRTSAFYQPPALMQGRRETTRLQAKPTKIIRPRHLDRYTLIIILSLIIMVMVGGWWLLSAVSTWWSNWQDDLHYGNPRTFQVDQFVGQGDSPDHPDHFIVVNTHGQVIVIQLNPQHPELDHIYGITTASDPKTPVSLSFRPAGNTWAMYVIVGDTNQYTVELVSNGKQFVSPH